MKVIHNEAHGRHDPSHQFAGGRQSKHADAPVRIERILSALGEADFEVIPPHFWHRNFVVNGSSSFSSGFDGDGFGNFHKEYIPCLF